MAASDDSELHRKSSFEEKIGQNLARARLRAGFSALSEASAKTGIAERDIQSIEQGFIEEHLSQIYALICLYECPTHEIFEGYFNLSQGKSTKAPDIPVCIEYVLDVIGFYKKISGKKSSVGSFPLARGSSLISSAQTDKLQVEKYSSVSKLSLSSLQRRANSVIAQNSLHQLPINVYQLAENLGIRVSFESFPSEFYSKLKGFCYKDTETSLIGINKSHPAVLQRFTLAHEIHHYLYDFKDQFLCGPLNEESVLEWNAERFAAELLMPRKYLSKLTSTPLNIKYLTITLVATHFGVSYEAAAIRLAKAGMIANAKSACTSSYRKKDRDKTRYLLDKELESLTAIFGLETGISRLQKNSGVRHACGAIIHDNTHTVCWQCGLDLKPHSNDLLKNPFRQSQFNAFPQAVSSFQKKQENYHQLSFNLNVS